MNKLLNIDTNKKKILLWMCLIVVFILIVMISIFTIKSIFFSLEEGPIIFKDIKIRVHDKVFLSEVIDNDVIELLEEKEINTNKIGIQNISFIYKYAEKEYIGNLEISIIDDIKPTILASNTYTVMKGTNKDFVNEILSGDNYDDEPIRKVIGEYDLNKIGTYNLTYYIADNSGNEATHDFKVKVVDKKITSTTTSKKVYFSNVINEHKNSDTEIGIDVSKWQGDIDFKKVKKAGCEFVIMRLGYQKGLDGEMIIDPYFKSNIEKATQAGLKIGVYIYTYAKNKDDAIEQAKWAIENIGDYKVEYGISYDWESWSLFNKTKLSYYNFTTIANTFLDYVEEKGYKGMLYSSKYYLENIWLETNHEVWLAHYTSKTSYQGKYKMWQMTNSGRIDGINGNVDINILYKNN